MADQMKGEEKTPAANFATTTSSTTAATNFEYDNETEWDVGIGKHLASFVFFSILNLDFFF